MSLPPSAKGARRRDPEPSEPHGPGLQAKTCSWSCLSWLHPLRSWSLRQTRGGSSRHQVARLRPVDFIRTCSTPWGDTPKTTKSLGLAIAIGSDPSFSKDIEAL